MSTKTYDGEMCLRFTLVNCLTQQISEYELLKSMYPDSDDIVLSDPKVLKDIEIFLSGSSDYTPTYLDFVIHLLVDNMKLEVCVNLPSFYPDEEPDVNVRCNQLNKQQESSLNNELSRYISENHVGDVCLYTVISWIQENIYCFVNKLVGEINITEEKKPIIENKFARYWIHSHHIYNKKKREEIVSKAKEYDLTGFCLPGRPGIICVEGRENDCTEWWKIIKSMSWKKITVKKTEIFENDKNTEVQKFQDFKELNFQNYSKNNKHTNMSEFSKYMEQNGLAQTFNDFFGLSKDSN